MCATVCHRHHRHAWKEILQATLCASAVQSWGGRVVFHVPVFYDPGGGRAPVGTGERAAVAQVASY